MTDERFTFIEDCKDKKRTARGASHKRTHCGKGGAVMFPSDYLTTKEKKAMNGECKTYRMNDPMTWKEFKYMPQDLQVSYITSLRDSFGANNNALFDMLGISQSAGTKYFAKIGLALGRGKTPGNFNEEAWTRWLNGEEPLAAETQDDEEPKDISDLPSEVEYIRIPHYNDEGNKATLCGGRLALEGTCYDIMSRAMAIIGNKNVQMTISWTLKED